MGKIHFHGPVSLAADKVDAMGHLATMPTGMPTAKSGTISDIYMHLVGIVDILSLMGILFIDREGG